MPFWSKAASALSMLFGGSAPTTPAAPPRATAPSPPRKSSTRSAQAAPSEPVPPPLSRAPQSKPAKRKYEAATPTLATAAAPRTASPASKPADGVPSQRCPHGRRRREFCPICDPDGYRRNFGDWLND